MITGELFEDLLVWATEHGSIPRISAVCTHNGQEIFAGGRGHGAHAETRYPIASITKIFTSHLLQQVLLEKDLNLRTPVQALLPAFRLQHPRSSSLTVHDLLNHQTPLPVHLWAWLFAEVDRRTFVTERLPNLECFADAEPRYRYSNIMYAVLGLLVEELSGATWEDALHRTVLQKLDMDQTIPISSEWFKQPHLAPPTEYTAHGQKSMTPFFAKENHLIAPASELISTAHDLTIWAQYANHTHPWKQTLPVLLRRSRPASGLQPLYSSNGWRMETYGEHSLYWHSGQCSGYTGILACIPDRNFTLSVLCNLNAAVDSLQALMYSAADLALARPAKNWFEAFPAPRPAEEAVEGRAPSRPSPVKPGTYTNPGYGSLHIDAKGHVLFQNTAEGYFSESGLHFPAHQKFVQATFPTKGSPSLNIHFEPAVDSIHFQLKQDRLDC
jgi:CubicO group peptidase (beta-lactamase class C family)